METFSNPLGGRRINLVVKSTIDPVEIVAQIEACFARNLPRFHDMPDLGKSTGPVALVAGGPSLNAEFENLKNFPGPLIACGSVHDYLIENGIIPEYTVMLDPDKVMADFVKKAHPDVCYLVASHSHPAMFEALNGMNVRVWHVAYSHLIPNVNLRGEPEVGGGDGAILRAWPLSAIMGHRDIHFYGFDLSFPDGCESQHAYDYGLLREEPSGIIVPNTGERFITTAGWMNQLSEFARMLALTRGQFEITIHGDGLVAATFCKGTSPGAEEKFANGVKALLRGDLKAGFSGYEYRQGLRGRGLPLPAVREWQGEPLVGKTLLLHGEQGHGDMLMVMRYVPILVGCGAKVLMAIHAGLRPIAERIPGVTVIEDNPATWPPYDIWCGMMSLPFRFGTTLENIPPPFEVALDADKMKEHKFDVVPQFKVGLCWGSNPVGEIAEYKSLPFDTLQPLLDLDDDVVFCSLQVPPEHTDILPSFSLSNFLDTAHVIANLDLVITVDTAVAHLAGTLGIPTWVILSKDPMHVPWMLERPDSPWYPSVRLFRQQEGENWQPVIERVRDQLTKAVDTGIIEVGSALVRCFDFEMELDHYHDRVLAGILGSGGAYEPEIIHLMQRALRPGDLFVDVGANAGFFTLLAAKLGATVIAIEPCKATAARLFRNITLNGLDGVVTIIEAAAWHENGEVELHIRRDDNGRNALWGEAGQRAVKSWALRLDTVLAGRKNIRLVKIDTEGAECHVLDGLGNAAPDFITCEVYNRGLEEFGDSQDSLRKMMLARSYQTFGLDYEGGIPRRVHHAELIPTPNIINILFSSQEAVEEAWREQQIEAAE